MANNHPEKSIGILWAQYGPYHYARTAALQKLAAPAKVHAIELASRTADYEWSRSATSVDLITLFPEAVTEKLSFWQVFRRARQTFADLKLEVCILPSYAPSQSLAALLAAKSLGIRTVMMNESHAGTAQARGVGAWVKRGLVRLFDAALVGGQPQKRYFTSLGLPAEKIFTGYDAVNNDYFACRAEVVRGQSSEVRGKYEMPEHYFLSLGRFVAKKNLSALIRAYRKFLDASLENRTHLILVGSGEEEAKLRALCHELRLPAYNKTELKITNHKSEIRNEMPGVHFYGFRQIEENPAFYALADAFILPSSREEWGLVVNEAMASGLPVIVSEPAGCAEDLLEIISPNDSNFPGLARVRQAGLRSKLRRNGFVFDPHSVAELSEALTLLASQPEMRKIMGQSSRAIVAKFSCENFARNALLAARTALGTRDSSETAATCPSVVNPQAD